jgi:hypothetical protein
MTMVSPSSHPAANKPQWRQIAYYLCAFCADDADYISARGLFMLCSQCKTRFTNTFGEESLELKRRV